MGRWLAGILVLVVVGAVVVAVVVLRPFASPGCAAATDGSADMTVEQADNAATIAAVGVAQGMPDHGAVSRVRGKELVDAVTIALATAMQESGLRNLTGGDRDSAGLFQQRPSQGWGTYAQVTDPVHAAVAFYDKLRSEPDWTTLTVTEAAQLVQRSAAPQAYARWEPRARAIAAALTGEFPATLTCHDLTLAVPGADVATLAGQELGTTTLSGPQPQARGWAFATWLVAHASRLGLDRVSYDGRTWTASSGGWTTTTSPGDGMLALHRATAP